MPIPRPDSQGDRVIAHVDMDCFYVQVEQRRQPKLRGLPTAVVQYNDWKGGGLIAVSYEARKFGVKRSMRGDEAEMVCPGIQLVQVPVARDKADLNVYRSAGSEVVSILSTKGRCERASIDEVYLDLTDAAESMLSEAPPEALEDIDKEALKSHVLGLSDDEDQEKNVRGWLCRSDALRQDKLLACGAIIVAQLRGDVLKETEFTCSAGIAHNKMLAKLASGMNKPAQQTIVPSSAVKDLLASLPVKKMKQLGGKLGTSLQNDLEVNTVGDLLKFSEEKLQERYGFNTGTWLWNVARGICGDEVKGRVLPKSHGCGKTFPGPKALKTSASVEHWLNQLCEELSERIQLDLDQNKRVAHTLTLHARAFKAGDIEPHKKFPSKSCPLRYSVNKVQEDAKRLFDSGLREFLGSHSKSWGVTSLAVSASKILDTPGTSSILRFFQGKSFSLATSDVSYDEFCDDGPSSSIGCQSYALPECEEDQEVLAHEESSKEHDKPSQDRINDDFCRQNRKQKVTGSDSILRFFSGINTSINQASNADWWDSYGDKCPELKRFAIRVLSLTCSSSGCERNWSAFEMVHSKRRNRLHQKKMNDLVFVMYNKKLMERQDRRDMQVKEKFFNFEDIPSDDEWITEKEDPVLPRKGNWLGILRNRDTQETFSDDSTERTVEPQLNEDCGVEDLTTRGSDLDATEYISEGEWDDDENDSGDDEENVILDDEDMVDVPIKDLY